MKKSLGIFIVILVGLTLYAGGVFLVLTNRRSPKQFTAIASRIKSEFIRPTPLPSPTPTPEPIMRIEIKGSPYDSLTKEPAEDIARKGGVQTITLISPPLDSETKKQMEKALQKEGGLNLTIADATASAHQIIAGRFLRWDKVSIVVDQPENKEFAVALSESSRLYLRTDTKLEIVGLPIPQLVTAGLLDQFIAPGDLVAGIQNAPRETNFTAATMMVFK